VTSRLTDPRARRSPIALKEPFVAPVGTPRRPIREGTEGATDPAIPDGRSERHMRFHEVEE
jgi:hypothetical protein